MKIRTGTINLALAAGLLLAGCASTGGKTDFAAAVADPIRPAADKARDADRRPAELIAFAGVKAGGTIAELAPGQGYFTRILTAAVGPKGHVYAFNGRASPALDELAKVRGNLTVVVGSPAGTIAVPQPVDLVWTTQNYHDFSNGAMPPAAAYNAAAFKALKPGGIYLVSDHEAGPNAPADVTSKLHRIGSDRVKKEVEAAGFKLVGTSNILAHAPDDHSKQVFDTGVRGKTDQFVLKFRKPK